MRRSRLLRVPRASSSLAGDLARLIDTLHLEANDFQEMGRPLRPIRGSGGITLAEPNNAALRGRRARSCRAAPNRIGSARRSPFYRLTPCHAPVSAAQADSMP